MGDDAMQHAFSKPASSRFWWRGIAAGWAAIAAMGMLLSVSHAASLGDPEFAALLANFQGVVDAERERYHIPGMTAAFVLPDGRMGKVASGAADLERHVAMSPDSRMLSGSIGKTIASAVAIKLAEQRVWSLDDKLSKYLGRNAWFARLPNAEQLTIRLLLQHRSGIENYYDNPGFFEPAEEDRRGSVLCAYVRDADRVRL